MDDDFDLLAFLVTSEYTHFFLTLAVGMFLGYSIRYSQSKWRRRSNARKRAKRNPAERGTT